MLWVLDTPTLCLFSLNDGTIFAIFQIVLYTYNHFFSSHFLKVLHSVHSDSMYANFARQGHINTAIHYKQKYLMCKITCT